MSGKAIARDVNSCNAVIKGLSDNIYELRELAVIELKVVERTAGCAVVGVKPQHIFRLIGGLLLCTWQPEVVYRLLENGGKAREKTNRFV